MGALLAAAVVLTLPHWSLAAAPVVAAGQNFFVPSTAGDGADLGCVQATDEDAQTTLQQWSITGGYGSAYFAIGATTGHLAVSDRAGLDRDAHMAAYRLMITVGDGTSTSVAEAVTILTPAAAPIAVTTTFGRDIMAGESTSFYCSILSPPGSHVTQQWQVSVDSGSSWANLVNGGIYSQVTGYLLQVSNVTTGMNGYLYRCEATNLAGTCLSPTAYLTVRSPEPAYPPPFDAAGYLARNPDVAAAIGEVANRLDLAWQHYWTIGLAEGRTYSDDFQVDDYLAINPDLQTAFGTDRQGALLHWFEYGQAEGRMGRVPQQFEEETYFTRYPDVLAVFGRNRRLAWFHFATYGMLEGRSLDGWFTPAAYLAMCPDLEPALGGKPSMALGHWFRFGRAEGRGIPEWFDIVDYLARYPDVEAAYGTDLYGAWRHFVRWGAAAGRSPDPAFDAMAYFAAYPELRAGLGDDPVKALQHWIDWGKQEGRLGTMPSGWDPAYYLAHNPDLAAFGDDAAILWQHCIAYGVLEGREVAVDVKPSAYLVLNPTLAAALGGSHQKALLHLYLYGKAEGRLGR